MDSIFANNRRIAKNTLYLYVRTALVLLVSLYTSRVILRVLGVDNLGIYNVVGGIVAFMSFLQVAQSKATSRFITYELGLKSDEYKRNDVFSSCMTIHIIIAALFFIIGETVGVLIVRYLTEIPIERQNAAMWVYQFSLLTFCFHMIRVPYDSVMIAHENMSIYALLSIIEAVMKLCVVIILLHSTVDSLVLYGGLLFAVSLILFFCHKGVVNIKYKECKARIKWQKERCLQILSFSGWAMMGSATNTLTQQGVSLLFNNFVGLVTNAALGFANQVNGALCSFVNSFTTAFNPQIVKLTAEKELNNLHLLMTRASKFSFTLAYIMAMPMILNMDFLLSLWLVDVPQYTVEFCQLVLICSVIDATTGVFNTAITANGKIKTYQFLISGSFLLDFFLAFLLLFFHLNPVIVFASRILTRGIINMFIGLFSCKKLVHFSPYVYTKRVLLPIFITLMFSLIPALLIKSIDTNNWSTLAVTTLWSLISVSVCLLFVIMTKSERKSILSTISSKFKR